MIKKRILKHHSKCYKAVYYLAICAKMTLLTGCANLGIGSSEYSCPGMPNGVKCLSASEVYALTDNQNQQELQVDKQIISEPLNILTSQDHFYQNNQVMMGGQLNQHDKTKRHMVMRTSPQMMRIWISPWIDEEDDFHLGHYIFTEVKAAQWQRFEQTVL